MICATLSPRATDPIPARRSLAGRIRRSRRSAVARGSQSTFTVSSNSPTLELAPSSKGCSAMVTVAPGPLALTGGWIIPHVARGSSPGRR
eukprot:3146071-Pyramimonas_sp.AAC.1